MKYLFTVVFAAAGGTIARWYMLQSDYRQYPSYPQGWSIHLFLGFIGGSIGAILVPAFLEQEYSAISFLLLAASQFREVRNVERSTLKAMEETEMVPRGTGYIEGIARTFEARNYLSIWVALVMSASAEGLAAFGWPRHVLSILAGVVSAIILNRLMRGGQIKDIARVELAPIVFDGALLIVEETVIMNVALAEARAVYTERGLAAAIRPNGPNDKATLANLGQMQAIAHDVAAMVGVFMDVGEQQFSPLVRRNPASGDLYLVLIPSEPNETAFMAAVERVPVLESAVRKPLTSRAGQMMD